MDSKSSMRARCNFGQAVCFLAGFVLGLIVLSFLTLNVYTETFGSLISSDPRALSLSEKSCEQANKELTKLFKELTFSTGILGEIRNDVAKLGKDRAAFDNSDFSRVSHESRESSTVAVLDNVREDVAELLESVKALRAAAKREDDTGVEQPKCLPCPKCPEQEAECREKSVYFPNPTPKLNYSECFPNSYGDGSADLREMQLNENNRTVGRRRVAFNPLVPRALRHLVYHHPVFELFDADHPWRGEKDSGYVRDWLGVQIKYSYDCKAHEGYRLLVPSRHWPCLWFEDVEEAEPYTGSLPVVDDEYPQYIDMLNAVQLAQVHVPDKAFITVELGARYSTWVTRAVFAHSRINGRAPSEPLAPHYAISVEPVTPTWCQEHFEKNRVNGTVIPKFIGNITDEKTTTLNDVIRDLPYVNYIDVDIQRHERYVFRDEELLDMLTEKVYHVHIGTHLPVIHKELKEIFQKLGWYTTVDIPVGYYTNGLACDKYASNYVNQNPVCWQWGPQGPLYVRDGLLGVMNPFLYGCDVAHYIS